MKSYKKESRTQTGQIRKNALMHHADSERFMEQEQLTLKLLVITSQKSTISKNWIDWVA